MSKIIIDIETGGFSERRNGIAEIGFIILNAQNEVVEEASFPIKPYHRADGQGLIEYSPEAMEVNGLTVDYLINEGQEADDVCDLIARKIMDKNIELVIGHNIVKFDLPRLQMFFDRFGNYSVNFGNMNKFDTMKQAQSRYKAKSYKLTDLCKMLKIEHNEAHRALGDCRATLELYKRLTH